MMGPVYKPQAEPPYVYESFPAETWAKQFVSIVTDALSGNRSSLTKAARAYVTEVGLFFSRNTFQLDLAAKALQAQEKACHHPEAPCVEKALDDWVNEPNPKTLRTLALSIGCCIP